MENKKKYLKVMLILFIIIGLYLIIKPINKKTEVDVIKEEKEESHNYAIYLQDASGNYQISSNNTFPTSGYVLNASKTECYDFNNSKISDVPVSQDLNGKITVTSNKTVYCDLYFTKDSSAPTVTSFSITGKDSGNNVLSNGYSYSSNVTYKIGWSDTDVTHYCLTTNATSCDKTWVLTNGATSVNVSNNTFTGTEGSHTIYVYLKDKAQNVSSTTTTSTKTITVDRTAPVVKSLTLTGKDSTNGNLTNGYTYSNTISWSSEWDDTDVANICVVNGTSCTPGSTTAKSGSVTIENTEGTKTVVIQVKDYANNVSTAVTQTITVDKTAPSITGFTITGKTASGSTLNTSYSQQVGVTYSLTWSASDVSGYCITSGSSCSNFATVSSGTSVSSTTPNLPTGDGNKTMNAFIMDKANNVSTVSSASIFLDLNNPTVTSVTYTTKDTSSITVNVSGSDTAGGSGVVTKQCKATTQSSWTTQNGNTCKVTGLNENTQYTIEGRVIDASGRTSTNTNYTKVTQITDTSYICAEGTKVYDASKGASSGGYICTVSAGDMGWGGEEYYFCQMTIGGTMVSHGSNDYGYAIGWCGNASRLVLKEYAKKNESGATSDYYYKCCSEYAKDETGEYLCEYYPSSTFHPSSSSTCTTVHVSWPIFGTEYYYCDPASGWNEYSGNGSTLQCYKAATKK